MQHAWQPLVLDVAVMPQRLRRQVGTGQGLADQAIALDGLERGRAAEGEVEGAVADQLTVGHRGGAARSRHPPPGHDEPVHRLMQAFCRAREQGGTCLGRGERDLRTTALDRRAGIGTTLVRRNVGVDRGHGDLVQVEVQFLGGDLREPGRAALPEFDEAEVQRCRAVGMNREPAVDLLRVRRTGDAATRGG